MRGLGVALIERGDFAGATSSRSSKLIHGGLRYLPQGELRLVRTALAERERLRRLTAPHLVKPLRFLFPLYHGRGPGRFALGAGLWLYDLFARTPRAERHRRVNAARALAAEPMLNPVALAGGAFYYDAGGDDARLTIENMLDAAYHRAAVANYVELERFSHAEGRIAAAEVRDRLGGTRFELRARLFVNAAGPWIDDVRRLDDPAAAPSVRLTKGVHLVIDRERLPVREALVLGDAHGRIVFVIPHGEVVLVGTTDTDFEGDRERVAAEPEDLDYLLGVVEQSLQGAALTPADVAASFAGLRALAAAGDGRAPSSVSREEVIIESGTGLISIAGGKLTTHREIAERIVDRAAKILGRGAGRSPTRDTPLPGRAPGGNRGSRRRRSGARRTAGGFARGDGRALWDSRDRAGESRSRIARVGAAARSRMPGRGRRGSLRDALRDGVVGRRFHPAAYRALMASSTIRQPGGRGGGAPDGGRVWMGPRTRAVRVRGVQSRAASSAGRRRGTIVTAEAESQSR